MIRTHRTWACYSFVIATILAAPAHADGESWQHHSRSVIPPARPHGAVLAACSARVPVCVHVVNDAPLQLVAPAMAAAEHAWIALAATGLPQPQPDGGLGGTFAFDLFLDATRIGAGAVADVALSYGGLDRASAYAWVGTEQLGPACAFASHIARTIAQAILLGIDPAMHHGTLAMHSSFLASMIARCAPLETEAIDTFQRSPEVALNRSHRWQLSGAMLVPDHLDVAYGNGPPGRVMSSLIAIAAQRTPHNSERWHNEPDMYDSLRRLLKPVKRHLGDVLIELAIARAFVGSRSDGAHLPDTERFGDMGRVRFDWAVDLASLPRRLAPLHPIEPTGSSYVWLDLTGATSKDQLLVAAEWEESFVFRWAVVKLDAEGREIGRRVASGVWGAHTMQLTIARIDDAASLLVVATSVGNDDRGDPYDPDSGESRAASYEVTLYRQ